MVVSDREVARLRLLWSRSLIPDQMLHNFKLSTEFFNPRRDPAGTSTSKKIPVTLAIAAAPARRTHAKTALRSAFRKILGPTAPAMAHLVDVLNLFWKQYLASLYWTIATLMSVGYGDISANNNRERMFALVTMVSNSRRPYHIPGIWHDKSTLTLSGREKPPHMNNGRSTRDDQRKTTPRMLSLEKLCRGPSVFVGPREFVSLALTRGQVTNPCKARGLAA